MRNVAMLSVMYLLFLSILVSITGIGTFPPPSYEWTFGGVSGFGAFTITLNFLNVLAMGAVIITLLGVMIIASIHAVGSGITIKWKFVFVVLMGTFIAFAFGYSLTAMLEDVPLEFQAVFVWPFLFSLMYSVVRMSAGGD